MTEIKYPIFFRILAAFNLITALILGFIVVLAFLDTPFSYLLVTVFSVAAIWLLVSAFAWFFASAKSYTFLYTTLIVLLMLAGAFLYYGYTGDSSKDVKSGMSILTLIMLVYAAFPCLGMFFGPVKNWERAQKNQKAFAPNLTIASIFIVSVAFSFSWQAYTTQTGIFSNDQGPALDTTLAFQESNDEPPVDVPQRDLPMETLVAIYSGFTIDSAYKYEYGSPYLETTEQITINGKQYGEFVGGTEALMKELLVSIMANQELYFDNYANTYDYNIRKKCIESLSNGITPYTNNDQLLQGLYQRYIFQQINIQIVEWGARNFIPDPQTVFYNYEAQEIYRVVFRRFFRLMTLSYKYINENYNIQEEVDWYLSNINNEQFYAAYELMNRYPGALSEFDIEDCPYNYFRPAHAIGFWIRRHHDGTDMALFNALSTLMQQYDNEWWYQQFNAEEGD